MGTAPVSTLEGWTRAPFTGAGLTYDCFEKGSGPGVVLIPELPGATPEVLALGDHLVAEGFAVVIPSPFGDPGRDQTPGYLIGTLARIFWLGAPRWVYVPVYVALGWVAVWFFPEFYRSGGLAIVLLIAGGGLAYTLGAVVYGTKWPNPSPRWFGFHEIFHVLTVIGYGCHYIAVSMASYGSA